MATAVGSQPVGDHHLVTKTTKTRLQPPQKPIPQQTIVNQPDGKILNQRDV
ncbi:MAG: hypothetical protein LBK42_04320 [Propionibacteriaceae bacterium]|jgi:hypothetical protein|nr:hypothetical protein [Propionibacteriaceae bacterium]